VLQLDLRECSQKSWPSLCVLQCVAVRCSVLQCIAGGFSGVFSKVRSSLCVLQCVAVRCSVLQCVAVGS